MAVALTSIGAGSALACGVAVALTMVGAGSALACGVAVALTSIGAGSGSWEGGISSAGVW